MPGETLEDALVAAERYAPKGIGALFTHLGENLVDAAEADAVAAHYLDALEQIKARGIDCEISLKLTQLGLDLAHNQTFRVSGQKQLHDPEPRLSSHRGEHVRIPDDLFAG